MLDSENSNNLFKTAVPKCNLIISPMPGTCKMIDVPPSNYYLKEINEILQVTELLSKQKYFVTK